MSFERNMRGFGRRNHLRQFLFDMLRETWPLVFVWAAAWGFIFWGVYRLAVALIEVSKANGVKGL